MRQPARPSCRAHLWSIPSQHLVTPLLLPSLRQESRPASSRWTPLEPQGLLQPTAVPLRCGSRPAAASTACSGSLRSCPPGRPPVCLPRCGRCRWPRTTGPADEGARARGRHTCRPPPPLPCHPLASPVAPPYDSSSSPSISRARIWLRAWFSFSAETAHSSTAQHGTGRHSTAQRRFGGRGPGIRGA